MSRILSSHVYDAPLAHAPADGVVQGTPTTGTAALAELGGVEVGIWEITNGVVRDVEVDEVFIVLSGAGTVEFESGESLSLTPGLAVRLSAGEHTTWTITEPLRKIYIA